MISLMSQFFRAASWAGLIDKNNVLQLAARDGHTRAVKALLRAGADVHALEDAALRIAAWEGCTDAVKVLLEAGANVHAENDEALRSAEKLSHRETAGLLREWMTHDNPYQSLTSQPKNG